MGCLVLSSWDRPRTRQFRRRHYQEQRRGVWKRTAAVRVAGTGHLGRFGAFVTVDFTRRSSHGRRRL